MTQRLPTSAHTPPWLFLILLIPTGVCSGFCLTVLPYLLRQAGFSVETASAMVALTVLPLAWKPLWSPLLDLGMRRRSFYIGAGLAATASLLGAIHALETRQAGLLTWLLLVMNVAAATSDTALGCLCAITVGPAGKERAAGFYSAGMVCCSGIFGGLMLLLHEPPALLAFVCKPLSLHAIGYLLAGPMLGLTLLARFIPEPAPQRQRFGAHLRSVFGDAWRTLRRQRAWTGLLICISPLCSAAGGNLFGTLASDFHAGASEVVIATGLHAALSSGIGSLVGGKLAAQLGSRKAHVIAGLLLAGAAVGIVLCPTRPGFYIAGCLVYAVASGIAYGTFYSFVFELVGPTAGATTTYGFFVGASNLAVAYVTFADGQMYKYGGRRGLLGCDAGANLLGVIVVIAVHHYLRRRARSDQPGAGSL